MKLIADCLAAGLLVWFALLALIVVWRLLNDDIPTTGFLRAKKSVGRGAAIEPERLISMLASPYVIGTYAYLALHDMSAAGFQLPELPYALLALLVGSNGLYLAGKIARTR